MEIRSHIKPGDIGYLIYLHGVLYAREYALDHTFESDIAKRLGEFAEQYDPRKDLLGIAEIDQRIVGSIIIHGLPDKTAMLRFYLVHPDARGRGVGKQLMTLALDFCREHDYKRIFLWTMSELKAAIHIYQQAGFECTERNTHEIWGASRTQERYDLVLQ